MQLKALWQTPKGKPKPVWIALLLFFPLLMCCTTIIPLFFLSVEVGTLLTLVGFGLFLETSVASLAWFLIKKACEYEVRQMESAGVARLEELQRQAWFRKLESVSWPRSTPEVEVEAKFVFQLLKYLGYDESMMELRTSVPVKEGSRNSVITADWVARDEHEHALVVIEAKAPRKALTEDVRKQARSYAFRLGAPIYMITNGVSLQVFCLGVVEDRCLVNCEVSQLADSWEQIEKVASKAQAVLLHDSLKPNL